MTAVAPAHTARPNGWYGMLLLIATEATIFGALIATYAYLRFNTVAWPPRGVAVPAATAPVILALVLLLTAAPLFVAVRIAAAGRRGPAIAMLAGAASVQAVYLAIQIHLYADQLTTLHPDANAYASIYYTLLAVHHAHVAVGLLLELWIIARLAVGWTPYRQTSLSIIALYWYFVVLAGLAVTATTLYPAW
jgi:heme/copper-type cytochrome/quinol oxidase subunit 3